MLDRAAIPWHQTARELREEGWSNGAIARHVGVSKSQVRRVLNGRLVDARGQHWARKPKPAKVERKPRQPRRLYDAAAAREAAKAFARGEIGLADLRAVLRCQP
jgi:predicted transcriptional regulator